MDKDNWAAQRPAQQPAQRPAQRPAQAAPPVRLRRRNELPPDLATLSVRELKALARERKVNIDYAMEKSELVAKIEATFR